MSILAAKSRPCKCGLAGMAIASHRKSHRIPRFFWKNIASNYRIKTTTKIASVIALQSLTKKISDYFDFLSLILLVSFAGYKLTVSSL